MTYYPLKNDDHDAARNEAVDLFASKLPVTMPVAA
jgi:hypothetical protein